MHPRSTKDYKLSRIKIAAGVVLGGATLGYQMNLNCEKATKKIVGVRMRKQQNKIFLKELVK